MLKTHLKASKGSKPQLWFQSMPRNHYIGSTRNLDKRVCPPSSGNIRCSILLHVSDFVTLPTNSCLSSRQLSVQCIDCSYPWIQMSTTGHHLFYTLLLLFYAQTPQSLTMADCFPSALGTVYRSSSPRIRCPIVLHVSHYCSTFNHFSCLLTRFQHTSSCVLCTASPVTHNGRLFPVSSRYSVLQQLSVDPLSQCTTCFFTIVPHPTTFSQRHSHPTFITDNAPRTDSPETHIMLHVINCQRQPCPTYLSARDHYVPVPSATLHTLLIMLRTLFIAHTSQCAQIYTHITVAQFFYYVIHAIYLSHKPNCTCISTSLTI